MKLKHHLIISCLGSLALLTFAACADDDLGNGSDGDKDTNVSFIVSQAQDNVQGNTPDAHNSQAAMLKVMPGTRALFAHQLALQGLTPEDLTTQKLPVQGAAGTCLIETTTAGIDHPTQNRATVATRANVMTSFGTAHFATIGYRGTSAASVATISSTPWFHDADTKADGVLVSPIRWSWGQPYGKFFGIYPRPADYAKLTLSPSTATSRPYVDYEVEQNVTNQKDLMVACSGTVQYATRFAAPTTNLAFRHALTAIRFKVGQNLSWDKTITKIEIIGAKSKGRYTPSTEADGTGATWSSLSAPATFTLDGLSVSTSEAVNNIIVGKNNDNYTFYMIPQTLTGVSIKVYFSDGSTPISANLTGQWKAGTTKVYALSQITSNWNYVLNVTGPTWPIAFNQTNAGWYNIVSYREFNGTQQPVKWKVIGYEEYDNATNSWIDKGMTRPTWLDALPRTEGDGSTWGEGGPATVQTSVTDKLAARNKALKEATPLGSAGSYYDLSTKGGSAARYTANCYVISAPGYYKIPLVYGNAIANNATNAHSYQTSVGGSVLQHFKDHMEVDINNPWITLTNGGANVPDGAKVVWADESGIVETSSIGLEGSGTNAFVHFHIPADKIKNGNAVIAVTKGGTVVWSWHLWFAPQEVLQTIACTNKTNHVYNFTQETLGFKYIAWSGSTYSAPRKVKIKVEQQAVNNSVKQHGEIVITQNNGNVRQGISTLYQWGRKDALPGTDNIYDGTFIKGDGSISIKNSIQNPSTFYKSSGDWNSKFSYNNLWSIDKADRSFDDGPVVKTIYDPCPAGFKMPASNAFTGFLKADNSPNTVGSWENGNTFNNKVDNPDATIYFPATGDREWGSGDLESVNWQGRYWQASMDPNGSGGCLISDNGNVIPHHNIHSRPYASAVRPVKE